MFINGYVYKDGKEWLIEVPALDLMTQGHTKKEAYEMLCDAINSLVDRKNLKTKVSPISNGEFVLGANDDVAMVALILKRQRVKSGLTLSDMAKRLDSTSKNAYAQYEQGRNLPSLTKLQQFLSLMNSKIVISFNLINEVEKNVA